VGYWLFYKLVRVLYAQARIKTALTETDKPVLPLSEYGEGNVRFSAMA
jgi:hypothetical protein